MLVLKSPQEKMAEMDAESGCSIPPPCSPYNPDSKQPTALEMFEREQQHFLNCVASKQKAINYLRANPGLEEELRNNGIGIHLH